MKLEAFFKRFDQLADTPDGVKKMRELVLRLAFSGGLTGKRSTKDGVPNGWQIRTIGSISASISSGFACSRSHQVENGHVHLRTHNISTLGKLNFDLLVRIDPKMVDPQKASIRAGDILFNNTNSQELVGKTCLVDRDYDYGFSNHITRIRLQDDVLPSFVVFYLTLLRNSGYFARLCTRWINQAAINSETLKAQTINLPPLAEQKRIIAKVDKLLALCDQLEMQQRERGTQQSALVQASLAKFARNPTPRSLSLLFHPSYSLTPTELRGAILRQVFLGQMRWAPVAKGSSRDHVSRLQDEHRDAWRIARLATQEKQPPSRDETWMRRYVPPKLPDNLRLPRIPEHWEWIPLELACPLIVDSPHRTPVYSEDGEFPALRPRDVAGGALKLDQAARVEAIEYARQTERRQPRAGDVIYSRELSFGWAVVLPDKPRICLSQGMVSMRTASEVDARFLCKLLNSPVIRDQAEKAAIGAAHPHVNLKDIRLFALPCPPLEEQCQIVAEVDRLMGLVAQLELQLGTAHATSARLLAALVSNLAEVHGVV